MAIGEKAFISFMLAILTFFLWQPHIWAMAITDKFAIGGILYGAYQYNDVSGSPGFESTGRGGMAFQPEISFTPTDNDEILAKFGFGAGNALNDGTSPFSLASWAADLEADVKNINGRDRDYLLAMWYKHTFHFDEDHSVGLSGGLIDSTEYLDENVYANDEHTQFMNEAFVNGTSLFGPSYDIGGALEWNYYNLTLNGVVMEAGENDDLRSFHFYGLQIGYTLTTRLGEGNYRLILNRTSEDFSDFQGANFESKSAAMFSFDQQLGNILGAWIRFGWQDDKALINYGNLYSGGVDISGKLWKRENDNIGIGYAFLSDGNSGIDKTQVAETYARCALNQIFAITLDVQWMKDDLIAGDDPKGFIYGMRMTAEF
jgi:porin